MAPKRKAPEEVLPAKRAKAEAKAEPKGRAKAEPEPKGRAKVATEPKGRAAAAKADPEPTARGKAAAAKVKVAAPRASEADREKELNTMIQSAKDGEFDEVFKIIAKYPPYVNERPEERKYSTIHHACYWGELAVLKKLVETYDADVFLTTKGGQSAIQVAKENGHEELVKYLETQVKKKSAPPGSTAVKAPRAASTKASRTTGGSSQEAPGYTAAELAKMEEKKNDFCKLDKRQAEDSSEG